VTRHATHWPDGTPRSQNNAFTFWRIDLHLGVDSVFARDYVNCTALYNQWRSAQRAGHGKGYGQSWAAFRDSNKPRGRNVYGSHIDAPAAGFRAHNGTIRGLSDKADAMIEQQAQLLPITGSVWNGSKIVTPPHSGAFSKSKPSTHGKPLHLARKSEQPKAKKVAA
jgi:hypothetical protein